MRVNVEEDVTYRIVDQLRLVQSERNMLRVENENLRRRLNDASLRSIEARNPGIDMDEVCRLGGYERASWMPPVSNE